MPLDENGVWYDDGTDTDPSLKTAEPTERVVPVAEPPVLEEGQTALQGIGKTAIADIGVVPAEETPEYIPPEVEAEEFIQEGSSYVTPESTVYGQLEKFLSSDSDYMKRAETSAREQSSALGMLSSSAGIGAAHGAAIDRAAPLAAQDAETYAAFQSQEQAAGNLVGQTEVEGIITGAIKAQEAEIITNQARFNSQLETIKETASAENALVFENYSREWDIMINDAGMRLEAELTEGVVAQNIDATTVSEVRGAAAQLILNYQISAEELLKDPEFLQLGADAIENTLNNLLATTEAGIRFISDSSGINMDVYLDAFIENATWGGGVGV